MDAETQELYIEKVEKFDKVNPYINGMIIANSVLMGLTSLQIITALISGDWSQFDITSLWGAPLLGAGVVGLVAGIAMKVEAKAKVKEIKEFFKIHGLDFDIEYSKGRSK